MDAVIHLASNRNCTQNEQHRSYQTVNIKDETLAAGASIKYENVLLLPLVGDIVTTQRISPGHAQQLSKEITVTNPYKTELVSYLSIQLSSNLDVITEFDLDQNKNTLVNLFPGIYLGKYDGRRDDALRLNDALVFIIEGAFEVQNRLLEPCDGLSLKNIMELEFEALSNEAILLIIDNSKFYL
ncbi:MAG: hypothetical protein WDO15_15060 [Bacteroidota bacterium]